MSQSTVGLLEALAGVPDFRHRQGRRFVLSALLASVVCGVLSGMTGVKQIVQWLHAQPPEFWHLLGFTRCPPGETCFRTTLAKLDATAWEALIFEWLGGETSIMGSPSGGEHSPADDRELEVYSADGKTLRGAAHKHERALHLLTLWAHASGLVPRQQAVGTTNEPKAAVVMFRDLLLSGRLIVADAMFCQREVCQEVLDREGHYLVMVKDNQPTLLKDAHSVFIDSAGFSPRPQTAT